jgi:hypothetical protein
MTSDPVACIKKEIGGAHGALVTAVSPKAFEQAVGMVRRGGTVSLTGLPPGQFPLDIFGMVLNGITVRGSIVGTRLDLQESLDFVTQGKVQSIISTDKLENINGIFARLHEGRIEGRVVLDLAARFRRTGDWGGQVSSPLRVRTRHFGQIPGRIGGCSGGRAGERSCLFASMSDCDRQTSRKCAPSLRWKNWFSANAQHAARDGFRLRPDAPQ